MKKLLTNKILCAIFNSSFGVSISAYYVLGAFATFYYSHIVGIVFGSLSILSIIFCILKYKK